MNQVPANGLQALINAMAEQQQPRAKMGLSAASTLLGTPTTPQGGLGLLHAALTVPPAATSLLGGLAAAPASAMAPKWIYVTKRFQTFESNLALTTNQIADGETKYKGVVSCLNAAYWGHSSQTQSSFFIGSWAKQTRIRPPRDVDLYFLLPIAVYNRFEAYGVGVNKQSALLQEVKSKLLAMYPRSVIKGDGPVVIAGFDSYNVEIVPAFVFDNAERSYYVCNTNNGGSYKKTMPHHEVEAIAAADARNNSNVRGLVRMLKCWQASCSVPITSFHLELLAIQFLDQWAFKNEGYFYYDWMCRDFFAWMTTKANSFVMAPGTYEVMWLGEVWKSRAESAHGRAVKACDYERANDMANAGDEWQKVFGLDIPKYV